MAISRIVVTGASGLVGTAVLERLAGWPSALTVHALYRGHRPELAPERIAPHVSLQTHGMDLSAARPLAKLVSSERPDVIVHAAYAKSDDDATLAMARSVAEVSGACDAHVVHVSTDAVFDGEHAPYGEDAPLNPVHAYGRAKAEAERVMTACCHELAIVRTSLITRLEPLDTVSEWTARAMRSPEGARLFDDEVRMPIAAVELARALVELGDRRATGVFHVVGGEAVTRVELGVALADALGIATPRIHPTSIRSLGGPRPRDLRLESTRTRSRLGWSPSPIRAWLRANAPFSPT